VKIWLDAQLSPKLANWMRAAFDMQVFPMRDLGMLTTADERIFLRAKEEVDIVITKDKDFVTLLERIGPPPKVIWITMGNTSNTRMKEALKASLPDALTMFSKGERLVEITG
jgi:predicted nuclease of predicted toxin-antitoxin system